MKPGKLIERLPAKPLDDLLLELQVVRRRRDAGEDVVLPLTTFQLRSGHALRGWLLQVGRDEDQGAILVQLEAADKRPSDDIAYFELATLSTVIVHEAERSANLLSFGAIEGPVGPAPSRLDVKRKLQALGQTLSEKAGHAIVCDADWSTVPETEGALRRIITALTDLSVSAAAILDTAIGKEAMQPVQKLVLSMAVSSAVREGAAITLPVAPDSSPAVSRDTLKAELEAQL